MAYNPKLFTEVLSKAIGPKKKEGFCSTAWNLTFLSFKAAASELFAPTFYGAFMENCTGFRICLI